MPDLFSYYCNYDFELTGALFWQPHEGSYWVHECISPAIHDPIHWPPRLYYGRLWRRWLER